MQGLKYRDDDRERYMIYTKNHEDKKESVPFTHRLLHILKKEENPLAQASKTDIAKIHINTYHYKLVHYINIVCFLHIQEIDNINHIRAGSRKITSLNSLKSSHHLQVQEQKDENRQHFAYSGTL